MFNKLIGKAQDIVIVGQQPWDTEIGSNCKNIAIELSKSNRVLYVNAPLNRITWMRHKKSPEVTKRKNVIRGKEKSLHLIQENLWNLFPDKMLESINWITNESIYTYLNKRNNKRFSSTIAKGIKILGFKNIILFNDNDIFNCFYLKELLNPQISIYYSRDYMVGVDYWKKHGQKLEPQLITKSDICVANSIFLANYCKKFNPKSYYIGQGCELELFSNIINKQFPTDIPTNKNPIIGYVGALNSARLCLNTLKHIALSKPAWNIVLVGPEDDDFKSSDLHNLKNIYFLGAKKVAQLPTYINSFDVCINPQTINELTIGNYPRKIDEYLAVGKPVVATKTEAMSIFSDFTYLASCKEEFLDLIEKALAADNIDLIFKRKEFVSTHTWKESVSEIYNAINDLYLASSNSNNENTSSI